MPDGTSTARIGFLVCHVHSLSRRTAALAAPSRSRARPAPNKRVDCKTGGVEINVLDPVNSTGPALRGECRIPLQAVARSKQSEFDHKSLAPRAGGRRQNHRRHCCPGRKRRRFAPSGGQAWRLLLPPPPRPVPLKLNQTCLPRWLACRPQPFRNWSATRVSEMSGMGKTMILERCRARQLLPLENSPLMTYTASSPSCLLYFLRTASVMARTSEFVEGDPWECASRAGRPCRSSWL